jgi:crossover junction endodeoxyribonuclease RuvC
VRVMGIDPSMTGCGLAIVEDGHLLAARTVTTPADWERGRRLRWIAQVVDAFIMEFRPSFIAMEGYAMGARFNRELMGEVGGIIKATADGYEIVIWANASWKKTVLGNGKLPKEDVKVEVSRRFNYVNKDSNQVEAFCVAMAEYLAQTGAPRPRVKPKRKVKEAVEE